MTTLIAKPTEGFVELEGKSFYVIPSFDDMEPFLMTIVSDADHWMFVSSCGALTAGRRNSTLALFPYETDDRLHRACGATGPTTLIRTSGADGTPTLWEPFVRWPVHEVQRNLYKSVIGNEVIFEEANAELGLMFRYRWSTSNRYGFVRRATLRNIGERERELDLLDGLLDILPHGLEPSLYHRMGNLANAYKRSEVLDRDTRLAAYTLEARLVDRPQPAESLAASVVWSFGLNGAAPHVDPKRVRSLRTGRPHDGEGPVTGRPGAYLLSGWAVMAPGEERTWGIVADVGYSQSRLAALRQELRQAGDPSAEVAASVARGTERLVSKMARSDGLQRTGDEMACAHHYANVTFNVMRGGIFETGYRISTRDFSRFLSERNRALGVRHDAWLQSLPEHLEHAQLLAEAAQQGDAQLIRIGLEYLPLSFGRRHGDPSRPWNAFSVPGTTEDAEPVVAYQGNWRDIFQNWEALALSFPHYLPSFVSVFVNASTLDGFNPYRINRNGVHWEVDDPDDPWGNIGYWGDHQIVYLFRLLEATDRFLPGRLEEMLDRPWFSYANVPYRIAPYEEMVDNPRATIRFDWDTETRSADRVTSVGGDGRLVWDAGGGVYLVTLLEKLVVPALSKLSSYVPGGGIWMNTQRPEWNDANNALAGYGLSMVTLFHLRRYLHYLATLVSGSTVETVEMTSAVARWLEAVTSALRDTETVEGMSPQDAKSVMDRLGRAFSDYRSDAYGPDVAATEAVAASAVLELCMAALPHLDATIAQGRRADGLYHSYNVADLAPDGVGVHHLQEMLEGQVAVLSSGLLTAEEQADVVDALFASDMYREDQNSFMLYPSTMPPPLLDKNVVPADRVAANPLLNGLLAAGDGTIVELDVDGNHRFNSFFKNGGDLETALEQLQDQADWSALVTENRTATLDLYEEVMRHREFTGRSGSMYGYEGIGSIYWHMVSKLLLAVQEAMVDAIDNGASSHTIARLRDGYWRVRSGIGFNKTAAHYGAFPADPYSHTPGHAGAQQPGMTGQVKEEMLTRLLEVGVRIDDGKIALDPLLLLRRELLGRPTAWHGFDVNGKPFAIDLEQGSLGMTQCQVPVVVAATSGPATIEVVRADDSVDRHGGLQLDRRTSSQIFARSGEVRMVRAFVPEALLARPSSDPSEQDHETPHRTPKGD